MDDKDIANLDTKGLVKGIYDYQGMRVSDAMLAELRKNANVS